MYMLPDPVCDCPCENLPTQSERVRVRAIKNKRKNTAVFKKNEPCTRVHILGRSPAFTGERTAFILNTIERSSLF